MIPNIAIVGPAGSGKTTLAKYIQQVLQSHSVTSERIALADGVKNTMGIVSGFNGQTAQSVSAYRYVNA